MTAVPTATPPRFVSLDRVGIKICGFTEPGLAAAAAEAGADALGFNFWPNSKRYVPASEFSRWALDLPAGAERVGVFVNAEPGAVLALLESGAIHAAQFHGDETADYCRDFAGRWPCLRALAVRDEASLDRGGEIGTPAVLLDAYCPGEYGGGGTPFDWELGRRFVQRHPDLRVALAGGLTPGNVAGAIRGVRPAAVDVASGVESAPGVKDIDAMKRFVAAVRGA